MNGYRTVGIVAALILISAAWAQNDSQMEQQLEIIRAQMKAAGMSAEQMAEMEEMYKASMSPMLEQQAAQDARAQAEFEARTADLGKAVVSKGDQRIELQVTECNNEANGEFNVEAQANHKDRSDKLYLSTEARYNRTRLMTFIKGFGEYEAWIEPMEPMRQGRFSWTGLAKDEREPDEITVEVHCTALN